MTFLHYAADSMRVTYILTPKQEKAKAKQERSDLVCLAIDIAGSQRALAKAIGTFETKISIWKTGLLTPDKLEMVKAFIASRSTPGQRCSENHSQTSPMY